MWALQFFVYALIVWLLVLFLGGTLVGYYFDKKFNFEAKKMAILAEAISRKSVENPGDFGEDFQDNFRRRSQTEIEGKMSEKSDKNQVKNCNF